MSAEPLLLAIAQIAIVIAGFAGLSSAFKGDGAHWTAFHDLRVRQLVSLGSVVAISALAPSLLFAQTHNESLTIRLAAGGMVLTLVVVSAFRLPHIRRVGGHCTLVGMLTPLAAVTSIGVLVLTALGVLGVAGYAAGLMLPLVMNLVTFYGLVSDATPAASK